MNCKISIIMPFYNTDKRLFENCLKSIDRQTYKNFELILVNDGSKNEYVDYLEDKAEKYPYIKVFHQHNKGLPATRNVALQYVTGDYYCFVDSDDYISENYLEELLKMAIETDSDIVCSSAIEIDANEKAQISSKINECNCSFSLGKKNAKRLLDTLFLNKNYNIKLKQEPFECNTKSLFIWYTAWGRLYKTSVYKDYIFNEKLQLSDDDMFTIEAFLNGNRIAFVKDAFYYYNRFVSGSITNGGFNKTYGYYTTYWNDIYLKSKCIPSFYSQLFVLRIYGEMQLCVRKYSLGRAYKRVNKIMRFIKFKKLGSKLNYKECKNFKETITRFGLKHNLVILIFILLNAGVIKEKIVGVGKAKKVDAI